MKGSMPWAFLTCIIGFVVFHMAANLIYAFWIPRFVRLHGGRTAGSSTPLLLSRGWVRGYRDAHAIRRRLGYTPWFLRTFEILESLALLFLLGSVASALWAQ
jgi:hypothetical protein